MHETEEYVLVSTNNLVQLQRTERGPIFILSNLLELGSETLELGSRELQRLHDRESSIYIYDDGILKMLTVQNGKKRSVAIVTASIRQQIVWVEVSMSSQFTSGF